MRLCFSDPAIFFNLIWPILRSKESTSNFVSILKKLLQKPTECCRKPSEIMTWAKGKLFMSQSKTFLWYKRFKDGRTFLDDDERSGRPSTSTTPENIAKVRKANHADRRQTIHDVCEAVGLSYGTVQPILEDDLNMRRISARFVPRLLSDDQKTLRVSVPRELKQQARDDPNFISNIITGDTAWTVSYRPGVTGVAGPGVSVCIVKLRHFEHRRQISARMLQFSAYLHYVLCRMILKCMLQTVWLESQIDLLQKAWKSFRVASLLKQLMRVAYFVCHQGCIMGRSEVLTGLSADFVLQIFIFPTAFHFRIYYVIAKQNVTRRVMNTGFKS